MMSEAQVTALRDDTARALADWSEVDGIMCATEPELIKREIHRERLRVGIEVLERVLAGSG